MGVWRQIAALPNPRFNAAAVWHDGKMYVFGGQQVGNNDYQSTTYIYDPTGNTWSAGAALPGSGTCYAFSTADDGVHVVFPSDGSHYAYDPVANTWATRTTAPGAPRRRAFYFTDASGRFYLAGGSDTARVDRYDPATDSWATRTALPAGATPGVHGAASAGVLGDDGKIYLGASSQALRVYDPATDTWSTTADAPLPYVIGDLPISRLPGGTIITLPRTQLSGLTSTAPFKRIDGYDPATGMWAMGVIPDSPSSIRKASVATQPGGVVYLLGGATSQGTTTAAGWSYKQNEPPTAPTPRTLTGGVTVSTESANRASWTFNDPNAGDSQSAFNFYYRPTGTTTWTVVNKTSPNPWYDFAAGTLDPVEYEWQVETYDAAGEISPRMTSAVFTADDPPAGPSITAPINGQTVEQLETVVFSAPALDAYQLRRVRDVAGEPDPGVVYFDTGEVAEPLTRSLLVEFDVNDRFEHVQVRVKKDGLWSVWVDVQVDVTYTPPPAPSFTVYPDASTGSLLVMITNPAPGEDVPAAAYNDVHVDDGDGWERKATELATNTGWRYWTPRSGRDYTGAIRVVAVAANGTTASSGA